MVGDGYGSRAGRPPCRRPHHRNRPGAWAGVETFTSAEDGFSAEFPVPPTFSDIVEMQGEAMVFFHDYRAFSDDGVFLVDVVRFTPAVRSARTDDELLDTAVIVAGGDCEAARRRRCSTRAAPPTR